MALNRQQLVKVYVSRLVNSLVPVELGQEYVHTIAADLSAHILSGTKPTTQADITSLFNRFKADFARNDLREDWDRFSTTVEKLLECSSVEQVCNYLVFLDSLLSHQRTGQNKPAGLPTSSKMRSSPTPSVLQVPSSAPYTLQSSPFQGPRIDRRHDNDPFDRPAPSGATLAEVMDPYYETLSEESLLTYISYSLLGLDSKMFVFLVNENAELYIKLPIGINSSYTGLLFDILEAGLIYRKIRTILELTQKSGGGASLGPIKTAFLRCVDSELKDYVNHINQLFNKKQHSLIGVFNEIFNDILKLRLLYSLVAKSEASNGYEFLLSVFELSKFGDERISALNRSIFDHISVPYYEILEQWIIKGELIDNNSEFFIHFNIQENHISDIIEFQPKRIPPFLFSNSNKDIGYKIFQIGKMLIFLNKYCKELQFINAYIAKYSKFIFNVHKGLKSMSINVISDLISQQYKELLNFFSVTVYGPENQLFTHLSNFKKVLLMGSNDFIEVIIRNGLGIFNEPARNLTSNQLSGILVDSINNSSISTSFVHNERIDARILDLSHGNIGWEVFTLEYKINDLAVDYILNYQDGTLAYLKIFNFLWKLRHFHYLLNNNYIEFGNLGRNDLREILAKYSKLKRQLKNTDFRPGIRDRKVIWLAEAFNKINMMRSQLIKFVNVIIRYLSFDVIEDGFQKLIVEKLFRSKELHGLKSGEGSSLPVLNKGFLKKVQNSHGLLGLEKSPHVTHNMNEMTFDELLNLHSTYLRHITSCKILSEDAIGKTSGESFISHIYTFLEILFQFIKGSEMFAALAVNYMSLLKLHENDAADSTFDESVEQVQDQLEQTVTRMYRDIYVGNFKVRREAFIKDLRADLDLKDLSKFL